MLCASFLSFSLSLEDALHLLQRFFNSSNQIKQIHSILITSNALVSSRWKTIFVYNTLIRSYLTTKQYKTSLKLFTHMLTSQVQPNNLTFPSLIKAACSSFSVYYGVSLHGQALKRGVMITPNEATLKNGEKFFNEGFSPHGHPVVITPNEATLVSVLSSCANLDRGGVRLGKQIHGYVLRREMILTTTLGTALLHMYGKAGHLEIALTIFDQIPDKEVCTWNAIISTLASNGRSKKALVCLR